MTPRAATRERLGIFALRGITLLLLALLAALLLSTLIDGLLQLRAWSLVRRAAASGALLSSLWSSIEIALGSTMLALPIGVAAAAYLADRRASSLAVRAMQRTIDALGATPSVIFGLAAALVLGRALSPERGVRTAIVVLACINVPLVISVATLALRSVPTELQEASRALGASRIHTLLHVRLRVAAPGLLGAAVLSLGRALAETAALVFVLPLHANDPAHAAPLALELWRRNAERASPETATFSAIAAAMLVLLSVLCSLLARAFANRRQPAATTT